MPSHILGYTYTAAALNYMITKPCDSLFISDIYHHIAGKYCTSPDCVEVSIRNAIKKVNSTNNDTFKRIFRNSSLRGNHTFLSTLRDVFEEQTQSDIF